jgi:ABC-type uncharacterized transport system ATPase subunit
MFQATSGEALVTTQRDAKPPAFELIELSKTFERGKQTPVHAVENISLSVPAGQVVGLLGPNGAGNPAAIEPPGGPAGAAMSHTPSVRNHPKGATG